MTVRTPLNLPRDACHLIFASFDTYQLAKCRKVAKTWASFLDAQSQFGPDFQFMRALHARLQADRQGTALIESDCAIHDATLFALTPKLLSSIKELHISARNISNRGLKQLARNLRQVSPTRLTHLSLTGNVYRVTNEGIRALCEGFPVNLVSFKCTQMKSVNPLIWNGRFMPQQLVFADCGQMTTLDLAGCNNLTDAQLRALIIGLNGTSQLRSLDLSGCLNLTGASLPSLESYLLSTVIALRCANTRFSGEDLIRMVGATSSDLSELDLQRCPHLTDEVAVRIGQRLGSRANLQIIRVSGCEALTPLGVWNLTHRSKGLRHLGVGNSRFDDEALASLLGDIGGSFSKVEELTLSGPLTDASFRLMDRSLPASICRVNLAQCRSLVNWSFLHSDSDRFRALTASPPGKGHKIRFHICAEAEISDEDVQVAMPRLARHISELKLTSSRLTDASIQAFRQQLAPEERTLTALSLSSPGFSEEGVLMAAEALIPEARGLHVAYAQMTDEGVGQLADSLPFAEVREFSLSHLSGLTNKGLESLASKWLGGAFGLQSFGIVGCPGIRSVKALVGRLQHEQLAEVCISGLSGVASDSVDELCGAFPPSLSTLNLSRTNVTDKGLELLVANHGERIERIDLEACPNVTLGGVLRLLDELGDREVEINIAGCLQLANLDLSAIPTVTDKQVERLVQAGLSQSIRSLNMGGCTLLTHRTLECLGQHLQALEEINLDGCIGLFPPECSRISIRLSEPLRSLSLRRLNLSVGLLEQLLPGLPSTLQRLDLRDCIGLDQSLFSLFIQQELPAQLQTILLTGTGIREVSFAGSARQLDLSRVTDRLLGIILGGLGNDCSALNLKGCSSLTDASVDVICRYSPSELLRLDGCTGFTEVGIAAILRSLRPGLEVLSLGNCALSEGDQRDFSWIPTSLKVLSLEGCSRLHFSRLLDRLPSGVVNLGLVNTNIADTKVDQLDGISRLPLSTLGISGKGLGNAGLCGLLGKLRPGLQSLQLIGPNNSYVKAGFERVIAAFPDGLQSFSGMNLPIDDSMIPHLLPKVERLENLVLVYLKDLTSPGFVQMFQGLNANIQRLTLAGCSHLDDEAMEALIQRRFPELQSLNLFRSSGSSKSLQALARNFPPRLVSFTPPSGVQSLELERVAARVLEVLLERPLPGLRQLQISNCPDSTVETWKAVARQMTAGFRELLLSNVSITDEGLDIIGHHVPKTLSGLMINQAMSVTGRGWQQLATCLPSSLGVIGLRGNPSLDGAGVRAIVDRLGDKVEAIVFGDTSIGKEDWDDVCRYLETKRPPLQVLNLYCASTLTDHHVRRMFAAVGSTLTTILLEGCRRLTSRTLMHVLQHAPRIEKLSLPETVRHVQIPASVSASPKQVGLVLDALGPDVHTLSISSAQLLTGKLVPQLNRILGPSLRKLKLSNAEWMDDDDFELMVSKLPRNLEVLILRNCSGVSARAFSQLAAQRLPHLRKLVLEGATQLNDTGSSAIIRQCSPHLQHLSFAQCDGLTDLSIAALSERDLALESLDLSGCSGLTRQSLTHLKSAPFAPRLVSLRGEGVPWIGESKSLTTDLANLKGVPGWVKDIYLSISSGTGAPLSAAAGAAAARALPSRLESLTLL